MLHTKKSVEPIKYRIYVDGFTHYKDFYFGCSYAVLDEHDNIVHRRLLEISKSPLQNFLNKNGIRATNNVCEYFALIMGLIASQRYQNAVIYSDSEFTVKTYNNNYNLQNNGMIKMNELAKRIKSNAKVIWISRKIMVDILGH